MSNKCKAWCETTEVHLNDPADFRLHSDCKRVYCTNQSAPILWMKEGSASVSDMGPFRKLTEILQFL